MYHFLSFLAAVYFFFINFSSFDSKLWSKDSIYFILYLSLGCSYSC